MDVNPNLLDQFHEHAPDQFRVQFVTSYGVHKSYTGTISDCLAWIFTNDKIVSVTRVS